MAAQQSTDKYTANLAKARAALAAGDFAAAERIAFALTVLDADRWEGHIAHGTALLGGGKIDEAREAFAAATSAPAEVAALAQLALSRVSGSAESAGDISSDPAADEIASKPDADPMPAEEPMDARDKTRLDAARAIAGDLNAERDPAKRRGLLAQMMTTTATVPSVRGPRIEMLFLRTIAAIELDDGDTGWNAVRELKRLGALTDADPAFAEAVAQIQRKGWDADRKPDFVAEKRTKLESELAKAQADFKARLEEAFDFEFETGVDKRHPRYTPGESDRYRSRLRISSLEIKSRWFVKVDVFASNERISGRPIPGIPDSQGLVKHCVLDLQCLDETDDPWDEPDGDVWYLPPKAVHLHIAHDRACPLHAELQTIFGLPRENHARWKEGANAEGFGGVHHSVWRGIHGFARSVDAAVAVHDSLKRWKQIAAELEALDAKVTLPTGGTK